MVLASLSSLCLLWLSVDKELHIINPDTTTYCALMIVYYKIVHTADLGSVFASIVKVIVMSVGIESVYAFPSAHFASRCRPRGCVIIILVFSLRGKAFSFAAHSHRLWDEVMMIKKKTERAIVTNKHHLINIHVLINCLRLSATFSPLPFHFLPNDELSFIINGEWTVGRLSGLGLGWVGSYREQNRNHIIRTCMARQHSAVHVCTM